MEISKIYKTIILDFEPTIISKILLAEGWFKEKDFYKKSRKNYDLLLSNQYHPIWQVHITGKNNQFDRNDWKLIKDLKRLDDIAKGRMGTKNLYLNDEQKHKVGFLLNKMNSDGFNLIYTDDYIIFRKEHNIRVFKIAAAMTLVQKQDGFYIGKKKVI